jgi:3'-phosphoadenosine 5'-phosphosulfate sulfotransferase (PAPS reductase)/FAD synthetase
MPTISDLRQRQALPLRAKVLMTQNRIREWYNHFDGDVFVSFSGGKDSTVLAHLVHDIYPDVPLVFSNTGLEYPEIQSFARKMGAEFVRPKMRFDEVISKYGYPIISKEISGTIYYARRITDRKWGDYPSGRRNQLLGKVGCDRTIDRSRSDLNGERKGADGNSIFNKEKYLPLCTETQFMISNQCCHQMKKTPLKKYQKDSKRYQLIGTMAEESKLRENAWLKHGCNAFESKKKTSQPMSFWTEQDVLKYIRENGLEIASVYGDIVAVDDFGFQYEPIPGIECKLKCTGCQRTGCIFCGFGAHLDKGESRFQRLAKTHPKQNEYCMNGGQWVDNPNYDPAASECDGDWKNWNPKKIWVPSKNGLGMKKVFDDCNQLYGKDFIRYE